MNLLKIEQGAIISLPENEVAHPKLNIILSVSQNRCLVLSIFINTTPDTYATPFQYPLNPSIVETLHHPCYANCSIAFVKNYAIYEQTLQKSSSRHKGYLPKEVFEKICALVKQCPTIKGSLKKDFKEFFGTQLKK